MKNPCGCWVSVNGLPEVIYCQIHTAAPQLAEALRECLLMLREGVASDCVHCNGEGGWTEDNPPSMTPVRHRDDCPIPEAEAALRAAGIEP